MSSQLMAPLRRLAVALCAITLAGCLFDEGGGGSSGGDSATAGASQNPADTNAPAATAVVPNSTPLAASGALVIDSQSNVVIENRRIENAAGACIQISRSTNVVIRNVELVGCYGVGVEIYKSSGVTVTGSYIANVNGGVYALESTGIQVNDNRFLNVSRRGKKDPSRGQFVQLNGVNGAGNEISRNRGVNVAGQSDPEDLVNLFASSGTTASPIRITGNCFKGGGPSPSGGGILTGERGSSNVVVSDNTLVDPGQYGIGIAGGRNITIDGNRIYARQQSFSNVGLYMIDYSSAVSACGAHRITNNTVDYTRHTGLANPWYTDGSCAADLQMFANNFATRLQGLDCVL